MRTSSAVLMKQLMTNADYATYTVRSIRLYLSYQALHVGAKLLRILSIDVHVHIKTNWYKYARFS